MLIAITDDNGQLHIMQLIGEFDIEETIAKTGIKAARWRAIDPADLPADRTYRDAWTYDGKVIVIDPAKQAAIDTARGALSPLAALQAALVAKGVIADADVTAATPSAQVADAIPLKG